MVKDITPKKDPLTSLNGSWKEAEKFLSNASSTEIIPNRIEFPHSAHTGIWDVSKNRERDLMDVLFNFDTHNTKDIDHSRSISTWLWENKIQKNIVLDNVRHLLKKIKVSKPAIELYRDYNVALEFQQRVSVYFKKPTWQLSDTDISENVILDFCKNHVDRSYKFNFIVQVAKSYFPHKILSGSIKNRPKRRVKYQLHPFLENFKNHLREEGNSEEYFKELSRDVMLFLNWLTGVYAEFHGFSGSTIPIWLIEREHLVDFEQYLQRRCLKGVYTRISISNKFYYVLTFFKFLYQHRIIQKNIGYIKGIYAERYLYRDIPSDEQLSRFFRVIEKYSDEPESDLAFFGALLHLGLRYCEVERLHWEDINLKAKVIKIRGKGKAMMPVPMFIPKTLHSYFENLFCQRNQHPSVFKGNLTRQSFYQKMLNKYKLYSLIADWNFPGGLHLFRHTFLTTLSQRKDIHPQLVQRLARHRRIETTSRYLHRGDQELNEAMDKIDSIWS